MVSNPLTRPSQEEFLAYDKIFLYSVQVLQSNILRVFIPLREEGLYTNLVLGYSLERR